MDRNRTVTYAYQWKRGGVNISGATANTYTLVTADIGAMITATVTATNTAGSASATATAVGPVIAAASNALQAQAGSFAFAGQSATLTPPAGGTALSIQAQPGSFAVSGESMEIVVDYFLQMGAGAFAFAGQSASLAYLTPGTIQASAGAFALAGQSATLTLGTGAPFTPASLANLYAWYKADAGVFKSGGLPATNITNVTQWNDQSGVSGINLIGTGSSNQVYETGVLNGLPAISCAGAELSATMSLGGTVFSMWALVKAEGTASGRVVAYGVGGSDTGATAGIPAFFSSLTTVNSFNAGVLSTNNVTAITSGSWNEIASVWNGTTSQLYINGTAQTAVASTPTFAASGLFTAMNATTFGNQLQGYIAEIVVVKGAMSAGDIANLKTYSLAKWGV
jgi:hypothetical protein